MKKRISLYVGLFLLLFMSNIVSSQALENVYVNYYGIEMTPTQYQNLYNLGFSEEEIYYMPQDIFDENKDLEATLLAKTQRYFKTVYPTYGRNYTVEVTEEEFYNHDTMILGQTVTTYETVTSSISANGSKYRYKATQSWTSDPQVKSYDVIAVGFDGNIHIDNGTTFYNTYTNSSNVTNTTYTYFNKINSGTGGTTTYKLPSSFIGSSAVFYFNVAKDSGAGTISSLTMCGDYGHALYSVTGAQAASHSVNINGISFAGSVVSKFDEIPCAYTYLSGLSW